MPHRIVASIGWDGENASRIAPIHRGSAVMPPTTPSMMNASTRLPMPAGAQPSRGGSRGAGPPGWAERSCAGEGGCPHTPTGCCASIPRSYWDCDRTAVPEGSDGSGALLPSSWI
jgi:hypothetical protein